MKSTSRKIEKKMKIFKMETENHGKDQDSVDCPICFLAVTDNDNGIECGQCKEWLHT